MTIRDDILNGSRCEDRGACFQGLPWMTSCGVNSLFLLSKNTFIGSKYPRKKQLNIEKKLLGFADGVACFQGLHMMTSCGAVTATIPDAWVK